MARRKKGGLGFLRKSKKRKPDEMIDGFIRIASISGMVIILWFGAFVMVFNTFSQMFGCNRCPVYIIRAQDDVSVGQVEYKVDVSDNLDGISQEKVDSLFENLD